MLLIVLGVVIYLAIGVLCCVVLDDGWYDDGECLCITIGWPLILLAIGGCILIDYIDGMLKKLCLSIRRILKRGKKKGVNDEA